MTSIEFELQQCTRVTVKICEMFDEEEEGATKRDEKMKKRNSKFRNFEESIESSGLHVYTSKRFSFCDEKLCKM